MVEINVKLEENSTVSHFTHAVGKALEEYLLKTSGDVFNRIQMLEAQIINYYKLHGDENFKDYFGIVVENQGHIDKEPKEEVVNEVEEAKVIQLTPTKNANKTKKTK